MVLRRSLLVVVKYERVQVALDQLVQAIHTLREKIEPRAHAGWAKRVPTQPKQLGSATEKARMFNSQANYAVM